MFTKTCKRKCGCRFTREIICDIDLAPRVMREQTNEIRFNARVCALTLNNRKQTVVDERPPLVIDVVLYFVALTSSQTCKQSR